MGSEAVEELIDNAIPRQDDDCIILVEGKSLRDILRMFSAFGDYYKRMWC